MAILLTSHYNLSATALHEEIIYKMRIKIKIRKFGVGTAMKVSFQKCTQTLEIMSRQH
jgi:hypothetical protein